MRTNLFKFKNIKKDKIILEEEKIDSPFLFFFKNYHKYILLLLMILALIMIIIAVYSAVKNLSDTTKIVTNISSVVVDFESSDEFNSVNMKPISGGLANKLFYNRYGNIGLEEGVILEVKQVPSKNGLVTYYSDGSSKIEKKDGTIERISGLENGNYGINENGEVIIGAIIKKISIVDEKTLQDGTKIIYYSDSSCDIYLPDDKVNLFVRNSDRVMIENNRFKIIVPSGISKIYEEDNKLSITYYEDGTIKVKKGNELYIVRNEEDINISANNVTFTNNNEATELEEISLKDGSKIVYYTDGSAEIKKANESIMVRASKDIVYDEDKIIEIIETKYANVSSNKNTPNNEEITYLNNGGALIKNSDGTYEYLYENSNIKYDDEGQIKSKTEAIKETEHKKTPDGKTIIDLEDGKSIIIDENGYRLVDTDKIVINVDGNIVKILGDEDDTTNEDSVSESRFIVTNESGKTIKYIIAIEVTDNYKQYASKWLDPKFLRFNLVENATYLENQTFGERKLEIGTVLEGGTKIERETYILYESTIEHGKYAEINLGIWLDYEKITNDYQDSVFAGTIKVYSETIE